jgi:hypothetical protein
VERESEKKSGGVGEAQVLPCVGGVPPGLQHSLLKIEVWAVQQQFPLATPLSVTEEKVRIVSFPVLRAETVPPSPPRRHQEQKIEARVCKGISNQ